jgi:hypothetical protein
LTRDGHGQLTSEALDQPSSGPQLRATRHSVGRAVTVRPAAVKVAYRATSRPLPLALDRPRSSGRLTPTLLRTAARRVVAGHRVARVGAAFCRALRSPAKPVGPVDVPARLRACSQARSRQRRSAGQSGRRRCTPASSPSAEVSAMPTWHRNSLGVGRIARRARQDTKPFSRPVPRLTLKAGHKEGLPTSPTAASGAMSTSGRASLF